MEAERSLIHGSKILASLMGLSTKFIETINEPAEALRSITDAIHSNASAAQFIHLTRQLEEARAQGLPPGRFLTDEFQQVLLQFIKDLDTQQHEPRRAQLLRHIVLGAAYGVANDRDGARTLLFAQTGRQLKGEEALVLGCLAVLRDPPMEIGLKTANKDPHIYRSDASRWLTEAVTERSGLHYRSQVLRIAHQLHEKDLVRLDSNKIAWHSEEHGGFTPYGHDFWEYLHMEREPADDH